MTRLEAAYPLAIALCLICSLGCDSGEAAVEGDDAPESLTVYCGRNERLIGPLIDRFAATSGIDVQVRYGETSELAAMLLEEGPNTPADVFVSQDASALGALSNAGLLIELPAEMLSLVPEPFRSPRGRWIGLSGRGRVVVYNTARVQPSELPQSLEQVADAQFRGRFGVAPNNASFQAHMAAYFASHGEESTRDLLRGMADNTPRIYPKNSSIVEAVIAGEIDWGMVNHYYLLRALDENPSAPAENFVMPGGGVSGFVNIAGAGLLRESAAASDLVRFLLSESSQQYLTEETFEYALAANGSADAGSALRVATEAAPDYGAISQALERTLELIHESGLTRFR